MNFKGSGRTRLRPNIRHYYGSFLKRPKVTVNETSGVKPPGRSFIQNLASTEKSVDRGGAYLSELRYAKCRYNASGFEDILAQNNFICR
jgi:hypothetical protein